MESEPRIYRIPAFSFLGVGAHNRESGHPGAACIEPLAAPRGCRADAMRDAGQSPTPPQMLYVHGVPLAKHPGCSLAGRRKGDGGPKYPKTPPTPENTPHPFKIYKQI